MTNLFPWLNDSSLSDLDRLAGAMSAVLELVYTQLNGEYGKNLDSQTIAELGDMRHQLEKMIQCIITKENAINFEKLKRDRGVQNWVNGNEP